MVISKHLSAYYTFKYFCLPVDLIIFRCFEIWPKKILTNKKTIKISRKAKKKKEKKKNKNRTFMEFTVQFLTSEKLAFSFSFQIFIYSI